MKRKVIKQGNGTLTITLPKEWTRKVELRNGDYINIEDKDSGLLVTKEGKEKEPQKTSIDISNTAIFLDRLLNAIYKKGYDEVELYSDNPSVLNRVEKSLNNFTIGFDIVRQSKNSCVIKSVADVQESEFENILRRTFLLLKSQAEGLVEAMESEAITSIPNLRHMEQTNNRYTAFLRRVLNKKGHGNANDEKLLYCLIEFLEKVADEYKYLFDFLLKSNKNIRKIPKDIIELYRKIDEFVDSIIKLHYKYDSGLTEKLFQDRKKMVSECLQLLDSSNNRDCVLAHYSLAITQLLSGILSLVMTRNQ